MAKQWYEFLPYQETQKGSESVDVLQFILQNRDQVDAAEDR